MPAATSLNETLALANGAYSAVIGKVRLHSAYQPIFKLTGGKLDPFACEALARPFANGLPIPPNVFFAALDEEEALLAERVLRRLHLRNAKTLPRSMRRIFLNLNPAMLRERGLIGSELDSLAVELTAAELTPRDVIVEITEQEADREALQHLVYELRARGYIIAVDDFGSDASNFKRVQQLTPDIVKVDGAVTRACLARPDGMARLSDFVAAMAQERIQVLLEGIENSEQTALGIETGAAYFQGYGLCVPQIAPIDVDEWLNQGKSGSEAHPTLLAKHFA